MPGPRARALGERAARAATRHDARDEITPLGPANRTALALTAPRADG